MSQENVEIVRQSYEIANSIGPTGPEFVDPEEVAPDFWARLDPKFELHERSELPDAKVYRGLEEAKEFWRKTQQVFAEVRWEPQEFIDLGQAVVVEARVVAVGRGSEVRIEMDETDVFWFREGMIVRLQGFATKAEALEAVGLREEAMSQEKVETVRATLDAYNRGDVDLLAEIVHPELEIVPPGGQAAIKGAARVRAWMEPDAFESQVVEPLDFRVVGNKVLVQAEHVVEDHVDPDLLATASRQSPEHNERGILGGLHLDDLLRLASDGFPHVTRVPHPLS